MQYKCAADAAVNEGCSGIMIPVESVIRSELKSAKSEGGLQRHGMIGNMRTISSDVMIEKPIGEQ